MLFRATGRPRLGAFSWMILEGNQAGGCVRREGAPGLRAVNRDRRSELGPGSA